MVLTTKHFEKMVNNDKKDAKSQRKRWCCVPQCKYNKESSLHLFPKEKKLKKEWLIVLKIGRKLTPNMVVCGSHFRDNDFMPTFNCKRRRLKRNVVPSVNLPIRPSDKLLTPSRREMIFKRENRLKKREQNLSRHMDKASQLNDTTDDLQEMEQLTGEESIEKEEASVESAEQLIENELIEASHNEKSSLEKCNCTKDTGNLDDTEEDHYSAVITAAKIIMQLKGQSNDSVDFIASESWCKKKESIGCSTSTTKKDNFMNLLTEDEHLKVFTGINFVLLYNLKNAFKMCKKQPDNYLISIEERIVLCLCKLKLNLSFRCLAILFNISHHTCSRLFIITLKTLANVLKDAIHWPTNDEIIESMPKCFKKSTDTYIILDCIEIPVEEPKCSRCRLQLYSHYENCETIKFLMGIAPSGLIMFMSKSYGGRVSDKIIFNESNILERLESSRDVLVVDKDFAIEEECTRAHIRLFIPPELGTNDQSISSDMMNTIEMAPARVHMESVIQRMKLFSILKSKISVKLIPLIDKVCNVICGIVNLSEPIVSA